MAVLLGYTWRNTSPRYHGGDWIMVEMLTLPGGILGVYLAKGLPLPFQALFALAANSIVGYLLCLLICHLAERYG